MNDQDVRTLITTSRAEIEIIRTTLDAALDELAVWQTHPELPLDAARLQKHRETLLTGYSRFRILEGHNQQLYALLARVIRLHESMKAAYIAGYDARLLDIEAKAVGEEYAQLRRLLQAFRTNDEITF